MAAAIHACEMGNGVRKTRRSPVRSLLGANPVVGWDAEAGAGADGGAGSSAKKSPIFACLLAFFFLFLLSLNLAFEGFGIMGFSWLAESLSACFAISGA